MNSYYLPLLFCAFAVKPAQAQVPASSSAAVFSHFIEGIVNPEDLFAIPDQSWVIVCSMASPSNSGKIYAVHKEDQEIVLLFDSKALTEGSLETLRTFSPHGIYMTKETANSYQLYVINHGIRECVEIFQVDFEQAVPRIHWENTLPIPEQVWANGLVVDSQKNIYLTSMYDPRDKDFLAKFNRQEPTGQIWKWSKLNAWEPFGNQKFSGPNGIGIAANEDRLYLSEWAGQQLHQLSIPNKVVINSIALNFLPDNIRWSNTGKLLIAGQRGIPKEVFLSKGISATNIYFSVIEVDPSLEVVERSIDAGDREFANATVAVDLGKSYWIGCVENNKIAVYLKQ